MNAIELNKLVKNTEAYVRDLVQKHSPATVKGLTSVHLDGRKAVVVFATPTQAEQAVRDLNGKMQAGGKKLMATRLTSAPAETAKPALVAPTAPTAVPTSVRWSDQDHRQAAPYHFVPVEPESSLCDTPVDHAALRLADLWTGELHCTLTTLTPLLAANDQYELGQAKREVKDAFRELAKQRKIGQYPEPDPKKPNEKSPELNKLFKKKILEPLTLPAPEQTEPGPVLISGAQLKGMIRHALSALLSAPMERVTERTFSYRPNIKTVTDQPIREAVSALVVGGGGLDVHGCPNGVQVLFLRLRDICYVHPDTESWLPRAAELLGQAQETRELHYSSAAARTALCLTRSEASLLSNGDLKLSAGNVLKVSDSNGRESTGPRPKWQKRPEDLEGWLPVVNLNGIDLDGQLNQLFHQKNTDRKSQATLRTKSERGYHLLLLNVTAAETEKQLSGPEVQAFFDSLQHLADTEQGHLCGGHPLLSSEESQNETREMRQRLDDLRDRRGLRPGDVLFLEETTVNGRKTWTSLGHQFYYRQRYRDSIHRTAQPEDCARQLPPNAPSDLRAVLCPRPLEQQTDDQGRPQQLSAARSLFGFVGTSKGTYHPTEPLTFGIGVGQQPNQKERSDFAQLAGRLAVNVAVEQEGGDPLEQRFLNHQHQCLVPLRPLGSPKPSAVEHYLTQDERLGARPDNGILCTYGDTLDDASAGRLRGRKFYLHQPSARTDPRCFELHDRNQPDWKSGDSLNFLSDQTGIGRFISQPGRTFRFTIRFVNMRLHELGALLLTLTPSLEDVRLVRDRLPAPLREPLEKWLQTVANKGWDNGAEPLLAHKLGHGRPLGLGSVTVTVDHLLRLTGTGPRPELQAQEVARCRREAIEALVRHLEERVKDGLPNWVRSVLLSWLQVHRFAGRTSFDYHRESPERTHEEATVFNYHTNLRGKHADGRKRRAPSGNQRDRYGLKELDDLD